MLQGAALVLGTIPGAALLAACGAPAPAAAPTQPAAAAAKPTTAAAAAAPTSAPAAASKPATSTQRVTIRDHDWTQGNPGQQGDWYDGFIAKFEAEHPDIKVEREWIPRAEMHAKQLALAATGQIGDTVRINVAPLVSELQLKGVLHDLDSLFASDTEWKNNDQKQFWAGNLKTYTRNGKLWGLPVVGHPGAVQYYINRTMIEKAGLKVPPADSNWRGVAPPSTASWRRLARPPRTRAWSAS
jgi:ABC-type glycerol-3-phosphate transport system substrate-binding protein